jgi:hypothetical protein
MAVAGAALLAGAVAAAATAAPTVVDSEWTLIQSFPFERAQSANFGPDGALYVGRSDTTSDGVYRIGPFGQAQQLAANADVAAVWVASDGDVFFTDDHAGVLWRIPAGGGAKAQWVTGFQSGDDDPVGMDVAPSGHDSGVLLPGEALVVDRGFSGPDLVWRWSPDAVEGEVLLVADDGTLVDALDVAITAHDVFVVDDKDAANGVIYRVLPGGSLQALATSAPLLDPQGIDADPVSGALFLPDRLAGKLVAVDPGTGDVAEIATGLVLTEATWAGVDFRDDGLAVAVCETDGVHVLARCDAAAASAPDCDGNGVSDLCDIALGDQADCNANGVPDGCDVAAGTSPDCDGDGVPDECPSCPPLEIVFVMDTSTSMDAEAAALCGSVSQIVASLAAQNVDVIPHILGITDAPGGAYACLQGTVAADVGTAVPGDPPASIATLGVCPGGNEVGSEDWGRATAVVAGSFGWTPGALRMVVPIADEGAWCGDPVTSSDTLSVSHATTVAQAHGVVVSPIIGSGASAAVIAQAQAIAADTGGTAFSSVLPSVDIAQAVVDLSLALCVAEGDCNGNFIPDDCEIAGGFAADCNGNGVPDECDIASGLETDCDGNGVPDPCDIAGGAADCNGDGVIDACPACPSVEIVFVMDTSTSMDDEAAALCQDLGAVLQALSGQGIAVDASLLGISESPGGSYGCLEGTVISTYGTAVPGDPPPSVATLGACPGGLEVSSEDWGRAAAVVAGLHPWSTDAVRVVVPIADEGPWCGDPVTSPGVDLDAILQATAVAKDHDVAVSPILGTGSSAAVALLAQQLASATGGVVSSSADPALDLADAVAALVQSACATYSDCDHDGVPDSCALASGAAQDCNVNGAPDACDIATGDSADLDLDGVPDECTPPELGCADPCCAPGDVPGCGDPAVEACVCETHPDCCAAAWTVECALAAEQTCKLHCPAPPACCAGPREAPGCGSDPCEACVCQTDPFCCAAAWDVTCIANAEALCAAPCDCEGSIPAPCQEPRGDLNGDGTASVVDAQCAILVNLWTLAGSEGAPPACLAWPPQTVDLDCDCETNVSDVILVIQSILTAPLSESLDADANGCPDACE